MQIRETNIQDLDTEGHQRYIDFGSSQSNRQPVSRVRLAKKSMRNENDSILSHDNNFSLQSTPERNRKKNDSPFLRVSEMGKSAMVGDSNLFSQIKQF